MESEPLLNRAGALYDCTLYYSVQKRGDLSPVSKSRGYSIYSMNKAGLLQKFYVTRVKKQQVEFVAAQLNHQTCGFLARSIRVLSVSYCLDESYRLNPLFYCKNLYNYGLWELFR